LLTGSGGPFRQWSSEAMRLATPEQACNHPKWSMGKKISVDSATLMNKGLEVIEACWLFSITPDLIDIVIHPQSVVHSMVEYADGSILAQLGNPDMRTPIAHALAWPRRIASGVSSLDIIAAASLDFEAPDHIRFPALSIAIESARAGASAPILLNAANEVAVAAFLRRLIRFDQIAEVWRRVMDSIESEEPKDLDTVQYLDGLARKKAIEQIQHLSV
jgi:1-deoxy-D-xylulose-5-phosphate reductoisomerase